MSPLQFPDVSSWQGAVNVHAYAQACRAPNSGWAPIIVMKATEGPWVSNPFFHDTWVAAGQEGLLRVAYTFLHAGYDGPTHARVLLDTVKAAGLTPRDRLCIDAEWTPRNTQGVPLWADWAPGAMEQCWQSAAQIIEAEHGAGVIYTNKAIINQYGLNHRSGWDWWPAAYPGPPELVNGWPQPVAHQYTFTGSAPGVAGGCDLSWLLHDIGVPEPQPTGMSNGAVIGMEEEVSVLIKSPKSGNGIYITNGQTKRWVSGPGELGWLIQTKQVDGRIYVRPDPEFDHLPTVGWDPMHPNGK